MTRMKMRIFTLAAAGMAALNPYSLGQTACLGGVPSCVVHVAGAGASAQFLSAGIAADDLAKKHAAAGQCPYHWTAKSSAMLIDKRGASPIPAEPANIWIVWLAACSDTTGNTNVSDIWLDASVDATVGVRAFLAQNTAALGGAGIVVDTIPEAAGNLITPQTLWPDGNPDVSLLTAPNVSKAVGTDVNGINDVHVNLALTGLSAADALFATERVLAKITPSRSGLGYNNNPNVGASIQSSQGTGATATPVKFAISGKDPITAQPIRGYKTVPIGAAPLLFVYNNNGDATNKVTNLITGVKGTGVAGGPYLAAHLFDGSTSCDTSNPAFALAGNTAKPIHLFLREPLSGDGNTVEYNLFRTTGNLSDSQEVNVSVSGGVGDNPLSAKACTGAGDRSRVIGTSEARDAVKATANGLGYFSFNFANAAKYGGNTKYNYLTVDGVDPLGGNMANAAQTLPNCPGPCTASGEFGVESFPTLRSGKYPVWSLYRWLIDSSDADPLGPTVLAQSAQDNVDGTVADFVPFCTTGNTDSLDVYRSHYTQLGVVGNNGAVSACNDSLGGGTEAGGDMGGVIEGPFLAPATATGDVITSGTQTAGKGFKVTWKSGTKFTAGTAWEGLTITINGSNFTISSTAAPTTTVLYATTNPTNQTVPVGYSVSFTAGPATAPGVLNKKR